MSFSTQRQKLIEQTARPVLNAFETAYLVEAKAEDHDTAVERLVDHIRSTACCFTFKDPLGTEFYVAKDHALNCLEIRIVPARRVKEWINDCLKCMDCILLVYMRDVLCDPIPPGASGQIKERDVYDKYEQRGDNLARVGACFHAVYQKRSELEHVQFVSQDGQRHIRELNSRKRMLIHEFVVEQLRTALDVMVPLYRTAFPESCAN